jgi:hypothetical protein
MEIRITRRSVLTGGAMALGTFCWLNIPSPGKEEKLQIQTNIPKLNEKLDVLKSVFEKYKNLEDKISDEDRKVLHSSITECLKLNVHITKLSKVLLSYMRGADPSKTESCWVNLGGVSEVIPPSSYGGRRDLNLQNFKNLNENLRDGKLKLSFNISDKDSADSCVEKLEALSISLSALNLALLKTPFYMDIFPGTKT